MSGAKKELGEAVWALKMLCSIYKIIKLVCYKKYKKKILEEIKIDYLQKIKN